MPDSWQCEDCGEAREDDWCFVGRPDDADEIIAAALAQQPSPPIEGQGELEW